MASPTSASNGSSEPLRLGVANAESIVPPVDVVQPQRRDLASAEAIFREQHQDGVIAATCGRVIAPRDRQHTARHPPPAMLTESLRPRTRVAPDRDAEITRRCARGVQIPQKAAQLDGDAFDRDPSKRCRPTGHIGIEIRYLDLPETHRRPARPKPVEKPANFLTTVAARLDREPTTVLQPRDILVDEDHMELIARRQRSRTAATIPAPTAAACECRRCANSANR